MRSSPSEKEQLNSTKTDEQWKELFSKFHWDVTFLQDDEKATVEHVLVKYYSVFARNCLDIGNPTEFEVHLTPQHEKPVNLQSLPTPTNLREALLVEHALIQEYGFRNTLLYSKYSSPIFAQRKLKGRLSLLVDLGRINHLTKHDYGEHHHPVTTISDAAQHMAGKKYFCKLDCSQAYYCIQMADEQSVQLLSNFGSRNYAYKRFAESLNRSLSAFTSVIREWKQIDARSK